jgi:cell division protein FtsQ
MSKIFKSSGKWVVLRRGFTWGLLLCGLIALMFAAMERKKHLVFELVDITINETEMGRNLVSEEDLRLAIRNHLGFELDVSTIADIDIRELERVLNQSSFIQQAEVYVTGSHKIKIEITQREPIVRIQPEANEEPYYLDRFGEQVPVVRNFAIRVPMATGDIEQYDPEFMESETNLNAVYQLAMKIKSDEFLAALIEQIHFDEKENIILIPKIGKEKILLGDVAQLDEKMEDLKTFYKEGITREGWNKFAYLNLKYDNQIIGVLK